VEKNVTHYFDFTPKPFHEALKKGRFDYKHTSKKAVGRR
jgi:hypothetical protein